MSGIAGIIYLDGRAAQDSELHEMTEAMAHRGRDGRRVWRYGAAGFAHCMLHTTVESVSEILPLVDVSSRYVITADARIDNRSDLLRSLDLPRRLPDYSDSELILLAYIRWGDRCVEHLLGDFAFAVWDSIDKKLFCARDHFGLKPFYFHHRTDNFFSFASEIKALHRIAGVPEELSESWVIDQLIGTADARETVYRDIFRLPSAHTLVLQDGRVHVSRYWSLTPVTHAGYSDDDYVQAFREIFEEAVECRLRSAFAMGSELSGGLDSSYVSCVARNQLLEQGRGRLHTFSHVFDVVPEADETPYVRAVLDTGGFQPHFIAGDRVGPLTMIDEVYRSVLDDFLVSATHYLVWEAHRAAADAGVRVLLNGLDGDTTVEHGELYLRELARDGRWSEFGREVDASATIHSVDQQRHDFQDILSSRREMLRYFGYPQLEEDARAGRWVAFASGVHHIGRHFGIGRKRLVRHYWKKLYGQQRTGAPSDRPPATPRYLTESAAVRFDVAGRLNRLAKSETHLFRSVRDKQRVRLSRDRLAGGLEALNHYGAYFGVESRSPFMDVRLVQFCLGLPSDQSFRNGWTRFILRQAMAGTVPDVVRRRVGKALMTGAFRQAVLEVDCDRLEQYASETGHLEGLVDERAVLKDYEERHRLGDKELNGLARTAILAHWMDIRFQGKNASQMNSWVVG